MKRGIVSLACVFVVALAAVALHERDAFAQPAGAGSGSGIVINVPKDGGQVVVPPRQQGSATPTLAPSSQAQLKHWDRVESKLVGKVDPENPRAKPVVQSASVGLALLFWAFAIVSVGGALFVVTRRNLIAAVMGMVGCFLGIAAVYMMLYAHFLSVVQMLVYAGAIMVLFVFVIMILNRPEDEPVAPTGRAGQALGGIAILYLVGRLVMMLIHVQPAREATSIAAPPPIALPVASTDPRTERLPACKPGEALRDFEATADTCKPVEVAEWGSTKAVGYDLFGEGLFPFEAISILLLIAVVGAIAVARPLHEDDDPKTETEHKGHTA
ncbi:MAG: NADH-quinone oxidoreductase subunit J [Kofleriaceae bacterium]